MKTNVINDKETLRLIKAVKKAHSEYKSAAHVARESMEKFKRQCKEFNLTDEEIQDIKDSCKPSCGSNIDLERNDFVYFISSGDYIKIGKTSGESPKLRLMALQTANPNLLILECFFTGGFAEEKAIHFLFKHLRVRGEWFLFKKEIRDFINEREEYNLL
jgi:hypothetical protein